MVKRPFSAWECLSVGSFQIIGDVIAFKRISAMACFFGPFLTRTNVPGERLQKLNPFEYASFILRR